jgi:hypothetical protein
MNKSYGFLGTLAAVILSISCSFASERPSLYLCKFKDGQQFAFSNFDYKSNSAVYKNAKLGWEGTVTMVDNGVKIDFLEKNQTDNGFVVTIDYFHKTNGEFFALYSSISPNPDNKFASSLQLAGTCN